MIANAFFTFISICFVLFILYGPWQATCTDIARQYCFKKRDALFDIAMSGRIDFDSSEYRTMRLSLEKTIRYCHNLSFFKLITLGLDRSHFKQEETIHLSSLSRAASRVADVATREELEELACDVEMFLVVTVILKSPFLWLLFPLLILASLVAFLFDLTKKSFIQRLRFVGERAQIQAECA